MIGPLFVVVTHAASFAPLCASIDGNGGVDGDCAGQCTEDQAPRWSPAHVVFRFDHGVTPDALGVDAAQFDADIAASLAAWNAVPSSTLTLSDGGDASSREFHDGILNGESDVFWTTDDNEWSNDTGFASNAGALGVTTHGYACSGGTRGAYSDSDIILNGTPGVTQVFSRFNGVCGGRPCPSSTTVLMHEIGHAVGLGHPCVQCSDALMSARAAVNHPFPDPDDEVSLLALYGNPGALGTPCTGDGDCDSGACGHFTMPSETLSYCTQSCGACPSGFACDANGLCEFASAPDAVLPDVGAPCDFSCAQDCFAFGGPGLIQPGCNACLELDGNAAVCVRGCAKSTGNGCNSDEFCEGVGTPDDQGQCKPKRGVGEQCAADFFCVAGLTCVQNVCTGTPTGEGEGEGIASEGEGSSAGEGEGAPVGEGEGSPFSFEGEGEGTPAPKGCGCSTSTSAPLESALFALFAIGCARRRR